MDSHAFSNVRPQSIHFQNGVFCLFFFLRFQYFFASRFKSETEYLQISASKVKYTHCISVSVGAHTLHYLVPLLESCSFHIHFRQAGTSQISCNEDIFRKFSDYFSAYKIMVSFAEVFVYINLAKKANNRQDRFCK